MQKLSKIWKNWSNPFNYFDAIYCINLDHRTDRWENVQKEFAKVGILDRVVRLSAVETPENGSIWCLLSHRAIIETAKNMGWSNVLVFEDDIKFIRSKEYIYKVISELKSNINFDLFYLWGLYDINKLPKTEQISNELIKTSDIWCTFSVAYGENFYKVFLEAFSLKKNTPKELIRTNTFQKYQSIDNFLTHIQKKYLTYIPRKICCIQKKTPSNIQTYTIPEWNFYLRDKILSSRILSAIYRIYLKIKNI